jgi:hypothetical protein
MDLTRFNNTHQKKSISVMVAPVHEGLENGQVPVATANHLLGKLPPDAIVTDAFVFVHTASDAATSQAATIGTASGGAQLVTGVNLKTLGKQGTFVPGVETLTGKNVWINTTLTGAATNVGRYSVVVEYLELKKSTGELTNF